MLSPKNKEFVEYLLNCYTDLSYATVEAMYNGPGRFYHTLRHIDELFNRSRYQHSLSDTMGLIIIFHDIIYNSGRTDNELESALFAKAHIKTKHVAPEQVERIMAAIEDGVALSANHDGNMLYYLDYSIFDQPWERVLEYDYQVFQEYQRHPWAKYNSGRSYFLRSLVGNKHVNQENLRRLIDHNDSWQPKIAIYPGSFNPFHKGHLNILQKAEQIFDKVIIAQGQNSEKEKPASIYGYEELKYRQKIEYSGLLTDVVAENDNPTIIRGLRSATDVPDEMTLLRYIQDIKSDIKVAHIFCDREWEHISSSSIRGLKKYNAHEQYIVT